MEETNILTVPLTVLHRVFSYLNIRDILRVRTACKYLHKAVDHYGQLTLFMDSSSIEYILRLWNHTIRAENVTSLTLMNDEDNCNRLDVSALPIEFSTLSNLHTLILYRIQERDLRYFAQQISQVGQFVEISSDFYSSTYRH